MNFNIGAKIKTMRLAASMTQEQLANKLGVSAQAVSKWESGTNMPDIHPERYSIRSTRPHPLH
jgi:transcriptional regulator with XRE-family HTH domain